MELRLRIILNMSCTDCRKMRQSVFYLLICPSRKRKGNCFASIIYPLEDSTDKGLYLLVEYIPFRLRRNIAARLAPFIVIFLLGYIRKVCALRNQSQKAVILTTLLRLCRYGANPTFCLTLSILRKRGYFVVVSERDRGEWCDFANF